MSDDDRREQILRAASKAFLEHGYRSVSMDDLAAELAISKRTLYEHFANKETLLQAIVDRFMDGLVRAGDRIMSDESLSIEERLEQMGVSVAAHLQNVDRRFVEDMERAAPRVARRLQRRRSQRMHESMHELIAEGQKQGVFRDDIPAEVVTEMIVACVDQLGTADALRRLPLAPRDIPPLILRTLIRGIVTQNASISEKPVRRQK